MEEEEIKESLKRKDVFSRLKSPTKGSGYSFHVAKREGFAAAVLTWTSSISKRRSRRSNFSFKDANLLFIVDSDKQTNTHTHINKAQIHGLAQKRSLSTNYKVAIFSSHQNQCPPNNLDNP